MAQREPHVQSIKRKKNSHLGENISQNQIFETVERERERERERRELIFLRRFLGFRRSEVIETRVKVLRLDEGYA